MISGGQKYLIACSGGPDSMALLSLYKDCCGAVAHVNYHHRLSADRDEKIVEVYCKDNGLLFRKRDFQNEGAGNFQQLARTFRYDFFVELVKELKLDGVLVAHQLDDLLETWMMQREKGITPEYYGLKAETLYKGVRIIRPLLKYEKKDLERYCFDEGLNFGIDESNLENDYRRNQLRHGVIETLTRNEKDELVLKIDQLNRELEDKNSSALAYIDGRDVLKIDEGIDEFVLRNLIYKDLSGDFIVELLRQIYQSEHFEMKYRDKWIVKEYGCLSVFDDPGDYAIKIDDFNLISHRYFRVRDSGDRFSGVTLMKSDFPLVIRNYQEGDVILMTYGHKRLSRYFKDHKLLKKERMTYPVVVNAQGEIVLVPGLGCNRSHYSTNHNLFVLKS